MRGEQRGFGPGTGNCRDNHRAVDRASTDQWPQDGGVSPRLGGQRSASREMIVIAHWTGIVGGKETGCAVTVVQLPQIGSAGQDVVVRIVGGGAQAVAKTQTGPRLRHD